MTLRDTEVIELLAGEPELLAIADALSATQTRAAAPRRRRRPIVVRVAIVAVAVVAGVVAMLAAPGSQSAVIGRALAAVGDGRVMHVVTESSYGGKVVDLKTGRVHPLIVREELWADRQMQRFHLVLSVDGHVTGDLLWPQDARKGTSGPTVNAGFIALWTGYRKALEDGSATLAGRGRVYGHAVYWIRFKGENGQAATEVGVDVHTYRPLAFRFSANGVIQIDQRILVARAIPYNSSEFTRKGRKLFSGYETSSSSSGTSGPSGSPASTKVYAPWLTAGKTVAGLTLRSVYPFTETSSHGKHSVTSTGRELTYSASAASYASHATTIDELPRADLRSSPFVPAGSMLVTVGAETSSSTHAHKLWTGTLRKDGIYVTIQTRSGERVLLEIARALHVAPKKR